jgi:uncharacterized protein with HEPN domain
MKNSDHDTLSHIASYCVDAAETIEICVNSYQVFISNLICKHALSMCMIQIGELVNHLSENFKAQTIEQVPWNLIVRMRDNLEHGHLKMDMKTVWDAAIYDIPKLHKFCDDLLQAEKTQNHQIEPTEPDEVPDPPRFKP